MSKGAHTIRIVVGRGLPEPVASVIGEPASGHWEHRAPLVDIYEAADGLILEADLPGASEESLVVQLADNILTLQAESRPTHDRGSQLLHQEFATGTYHRSFILSDEVNREQISAEWKNGVLRVTLPRAERGKTRRIEVKSH